MPRAARAATTRAGCASARAPGRGPRANGGSASAQPAARARPICSAPPPAMPRRRRPPPSGRRSPVLHLVFFVEDGSRQMNAVGLEAVEAGGLDAGRSEAAQHFTARADSGAFELVDVLHAHAVVLH